jgi:uncharacterized membrane protein
MNQSNERYASRSRTTTTRRNRPAPDHDRLLFFLIACINGITALIGVVIAHSRRWQAAGTLWQGQFDNLILVFWVLVATLLIVMTSFPLGVWAGFTALLFTNSPSVLIWPAGLLIFPMLFGLVVFAVLALWYFYRTIRGLIRAAEARLYRG